MKQQLFIIISGCCSKYQIYMIEIHTHYIYLVYQEIETKYNIYIDTYINKETIYIYIFIINNNI